MTSRNAKSRCHEPIAYDHDCREGIRGMMVNGKAHGPQEGNCLSQRHMRTFKDGDVLYLEPWLAKAFPVVRDLVVVGPALLPQCQPERYIRVLKMVEQMDKEGFRNCTNHGECEAVCTVVGAAP